MFDYQYYEEVANRYNYIFCKDLRTTIGKFSIDDLKWWLLSFNLDGNLASDISPENTFVTTGIAINHEPHIGTVSQLLRAIYFQKKGYKTQIILADLDSCNQRATSSSYVDESFHKYYDFTVRLGFDANKGILRKQTDHPEIMQTAFMISSLVRDQDFYDVEEDLSAYYRKLGIYDGISFSVKQAILLMWADFIHPGYIDGYKHTIVLSGIDEHTYVPKANEIVRRLELDSDIIGLFSSIIPGLNGQPKMSKSLPNSSIWANMGKEEITEVIMGLPDNYSSYDNSLVYQLMANTITPDAADFNAIASSCDAKDDSWQRVKLNFIEYLADICKY